MPLGIAFITLIIFPMSSSIKFRQWAAHGVKKKSLPLAFRNYPTTKISNLTMTNKLKLPVKILKLIKNLT